MQVLEYHVYQTDMTLVEFIDKQKRGALIKWAHRQLQNYNYDKLCEGEHNVMRQNNRGAWGVPKGGMF